jgi:hypothetical protein
MARSVRAIRPASITVGHVTCRKAVPVVLTRIPVGALLVINCSNNGSLVKVEPGTLGVYQGTVPIFPAGR